MQAELVKDGVPENATTIQGFGDTHLLIATGPGVQPQNWRVEHHHSLMRIAAHSAGPRLCWLARSLAPALASAALRAASKRI